MIAKYLCVIFATICKNIFWAITFELKDDDLGVYNYVSRVKESDGLMAPSDYTKDLNSTKNLNNLSKTQWHHSKMLDFRETVMRS